jgi:acetyl esterase/lipase
MIVGTAASGIEELAELVAEIGVVVVSPDYRLAPETRTRRPSAIVTPASFGQHNVRAR